MIAYYQRFKTEPIYLYDDQEKTYVKSVPGKGYFAKLKGGKEFSMQYDNAIVIRAIDGKCEVAKKEYD